MKSGAHNTPRAVVLSMLININEEGAYCHLCLRQTMKKVDHWPGRDKRLIKRLVEGTVSRRLQLDHIIDCHAHTPVSKMKPPVRNILRMSVYQIIFMDQVPDRAACDEAVKLAKQRGFMPLAAFINAILRNIIRNKETLLAQMEQAQDTEALSLKYSMPQWIIDLWLLDYAAKDLTVMLGALLNIRPLTVRLAASLSKKEVGEWLSAIQQEGHTVHPHPLLDYAHELTKCDKIVDLPGYGQGLFAVQDVASMLAVEAAGIAKGDVVLDVCAAPGGKALHAAERAKTVMARDRNEKKCDIIRENAARLGHGNVEICAHDATVFDPSVVDVADVLIADLPCSGLGTLHKRPDLKYRLTPAVLEDICALQRRILEVVWRYVRPGGILLYSTCTINRAENADMMQWFVEHHPFEYAPFPREVPFLAMQNENNAQLQLLPGIHPCEGMYICRLRRRI